MVRRDFSVVQIFVVVASIERDALDAYDSSVDPSRTSRISKHDRVSSST